MRRLRSKGPIRRRLGLKKRRRGEALGGVSVKETGLGREEKTKEVG